MFCCCHVQRCLYSWLKLTFCLIAFNVFACALECVCVCPCDCGFINVWLICVSLCVSLRQLCICIWAVLTQTVGDAVCSDCHSNFELLLFFCLSQSSLSIYIIRDIIWRFGWELLGCHWNHYSYWYSLLVCCITIILLNLLVYLLKTEEMCKWRIKSPLLLSNDNILSSATISLNIVNTVVTVRMPYIFFYQKIWFSWCLITDEYSLVRVPYFKLSFLCFFLLGF